MVAKGEYVVKEDGLQFEHSTLIDVKTSCSTNEEYLVQFRYVFSFTDRSLAMKRHQCQSKYR
jgi:hypothetical protein